jgi:hypothetical protein
VGGEKSKEEEGDKGARPPPMERMRVVSKREQNMMSGLVVIKYNFDF